MKVDYTIRSMFRFREACVWVVKLFTLQAVLII